MGKKLSEVHREGGITSYFQSLNLQAVVLEDICLLYITAYISRNASSKKCGEYLFLNPFSSPALHVISGSLTVFKGSKMQRPTSRLLPLKSVPLIVVGAGSDPERFYLEQACKGNALKSR